MLVAIAAINEGFDGTHIPSYGPESRGGTSYADVHVAKDEVLNPASPAPDILIAFNAPSLAKFGLTVKKNGFIIYDSSVAKDVKPGDPSITVVGVPFTEIAAGLGKRWSRTSWPWARSRPPRTSSPGRPSSPPSRKPSRRRPS